MMLQSKKYVKLFDLLQSKQRQTDCLSFQFPMHANDPMLYQVLQNHFDPYFSYLDKSKMGDDNQLYYVCQVITRIFL